MQVLILFPLLISETTLKLISETTLKLGILFILLWHWVVTFSMTPLQPLALGSYFFYDTLQPMILFMPMTHTVESLLFKSAWWITGFYQTYCWGTRLSESWGRGRKGAKQLLQTQRKQRTQFIDINGAISKSCIHGGRSLWKVIISIVAIARGASSEISLIQLWD